MPYINRCHLKNRGTQKYKIWYLVLVLLAFVSYARADDAEIASLFAPVVSKNEAAVTVTVPDICQEIIVRTALLKSTSGEQDRIRMDFLGQRIVVKQTKILPGPQGSVAWMGKPENAAGSVLMAVCGNALFGAIEREGVIYKIEPVRGTQVHRIFKLNHEEEKPIDDGGLIPPEARLPEKKDTIPVIPKGTDDGTFFDVLVLYTTGFADAYPGDELYAQISYLMGVANTSYHNSAVNLTARVVGLREVDYTDDGMLTNALDDVTNGKGVFSDVPALRNQSGADLVTLLRVFNNTNDVCGLAWQMTSLSSSFERYAYSVVQVGRVNFGGGFKFCTDQTLAHEMGHNMGCAHEDGNSAVFNYSRGYVFSPYLSVMAISGGTRVSQFSNPDVSYLGLITGTNEANNARSITKVKLTVSQFRDSKCLGEMTATPDMLSLNREESSEITVLVTGEYDYPVEGEVVTAKVNKDGKKLISVSSSSGITDSHGQATFTITAKEKKGATKVKFTADCLKKSVKIKVE